MAQHRHRRWLKQGCKGSLSGWPSGSQAVLLQEGHAVLPSARPPGFVTPWAVPPHTVLNTDDGLEDVLVKFC